jgi:hypothetical protein
VYAPARSLKNLPQRSVVEKVRCFYGLAQFLHGPELSFVLFLFTIYYAACSVNIFFFSVLNAYDYRHIARIPV